VVLKLFNICMPDTAVFGLKDYQQFRVIQQMVADLNLPVRIVGVPTQREPDGLAESSRNTYLTPDERARAVVVYQTLRAMENAIVKQGQRDSRALIEMAIQRIEAGGGKVDYVAVADPETLDDLDEVKDRALLAAAVFFGRTRLIDNLIVDLTETIEEGPNGDQ
jgi:pantoate--beta-alanine ligase